MVSPNQIMTAGGEIVPPLIYDPLYFGCPLTPLTHQDYFVESTRGFKHFIAKVTIKDNLLYACTGQAKESDFSTVEGQLNRMVDSFKVPA